MLTKVSVIVPTYKRSPEYLERALNSILNQTYPEFEVIVVDDNSPDSLERINIESFMKTFSNNNKIVYVKNEKNLGGSLARNKGINIASGEYLTFLDDDDEYEPQKIEKQINYMQRDNLDMSFTNLRIMNKNKRVIDVRKFYIPKNFSNNDYLKHHLMYHLTGTPTFMYKTSELLRIGGFEDVKVGQEFYLMLKTIETGLKIGHLDTSDVIAYRHDDGGISYGPNKIKGEKEIYALKKRYKEIMSKKERRYIDFRHNVVMAIIYKRNKEFNKFVYQILKVLFNYPSNVILEVLDYIKKIKTHQRWN